jgi:hypothetical protein
MQLSKRLSFRVCRCKFERAPLVPPQLPTLFTMWLPRHLRGRLHSLAGTTVRTACSASISIAEPSESDGEVSEGVGQVRDL